MVITDRRIAGESRWLEVVGAALQGGATAIQLRDKDATSAELLELALELKRLTDRHDALYIVNDRLDTALGAAADGVHLGDEDLPVREVRRLVPRDFIIGRSAHSEDAARLAEADGADYLGVGSVYATTTKPDIAGEAVGTAQLERVVRSVTIPVLAVGGIAAGDAAEVASSGAAGLAVVSAVMGAQDPRAAARQLLSEWERGEQRASRRAPGP